MKLGKVYLKLMGLNYCKIINALFLVGYLLLCATKSHAQQLITYQKHNKNLDSKISLSRSEKEWIKNHDPVLVAVKSGWMPIEFQVDNLMHRGYAIDYFQKIADLYQINFEIVNYTEDNNGFEPDIISSVNGKNVNNDKFHLLSQPFLLSAYAIYINTSHSKNVQRNLIEDLGSAKIAIFRKSLITKSLLKKYPDMRIIPVDIADEAFDYLKLGIC